MSHTVLWITSKWILPADDGSRLATTSLVRSVAKKGVTIDLLALYGPNEAPIPSEAIQALGVRAAFGVQRSKGNDSGAAKMLRLAAALVSTPLTPITVAPYTERKLTLAVEKQLETDYSHLVFEGLHPAAVFSSLGRYRRRAGKTAIVYRAQNCESTIWERTAVIERSLLKKAALYFQASRMRAFERSVLEAVDGVAAISAEDAAAFDSLAPNTKSLGAVIPIGFDFNPPLPPPLDGGIKLLFLGRLDWAPNRDGLRWFLKEIWPTVVSARSDISLTIAGSGDGGWLSEHLNQPKITFLGRVAEVEPLYRGHHVSIVPIFYGSGTRVKALEAARYGRPSISTPLGVEGTGFRAGNEYLSADSVAEWFSTLQSIENQAVMKIGFAAHAHAERNFSSGAVATRFVEFLDQTSQIGTR